MTGLVVLLSLTTWFSATAVLPELTALLNLSASRAAWLTNAVQFGFVVGALGSSVLALADAWPLTRYMAFSAFLACGVNTLLLLPIGESGAIAARFLTGVALAGVYPPSMKFIATWFKSGRGIAMGTMVGALTLGSALPHLVRGSDASVPWQTVVLASSIGSAIAGIICLLFLREGPHSFTRTTVDFRKVRSILGNRPIMLANIGYFGHMWELYAMWGWFLAFAASAASSGIGSVNASVLTFAVIAAGAPGCIFGGWLAERIGRCRTTILMMGISGASAVLIGLVFAGPLWLFVIVALTWGFSVVADSAQFSAAVTELSSSDYVGSSLAFQMGVGFMITLLTIWLTPLFAAWMGSWQWAFLLLAPGPIVGVWAMARLYRHPRSDFMAGGRR